MNLDLRNLREVYFLGIGGIGMSALARYFAEQGARISGYDRSASALTRKLESEGMKISYEEATADLPAGPDLVIWTPAVPKDSVLYRHWAGSGAPMLKRSEVLGLLSRNYRTIAVAGTHGKTTTSTLIAHLLREGGVDCTAFLGGIAANFGGNYLSGRSEWLVLEADEYDRSFLRLHPEWAVVTSMDPDHLDIYGDAAGMEAGYDAFAGQVAADGWLLLQHRLEDKLPVGLAPRTTYGVGEGDYRAEGLRVEQGSMVFDFRYPGGFWETVELPYPGRHNVENAVAALAIATRCGVKEEDARKGLKLFKGIERRFEKIYDRDGRVLIDDYAHHPGELDAAIAAARMLYPGRHLTGVFQPHLYTRTRDLADGFARALQALDTVILLDIYPARELPIEGVTSAIIAERMQHEDVTVVPKSGLVGLLRQLSPDLLMTLGAGDIDRLLPDIVKQVMEVRL